MTSRLPRWSVLALALAAGSIMPPVAAAQSAITPLDTVKALYAKARQAPDAPYMSARLRELFAAQRERAAARGTPMPGLGFNYLSLLRDDEGNWRRTLRYDEGRRVNRTAQVVARFTNAAPRRTTFTLIFENGRWLIDDIAPDNSQPMSQLLQADW